MGIGSGGLEEPFGAEVGLFRAIYKEFEQNPLGGPTQNPTFKPPLGLWPLWGAGFLACLAESAPEQSGKADAVLHQDSQA